MIRGVRFNAPKSIQGFVLSSRFFPPSLLILHSQRSFFLKTTQLVSFKHLPQFFPKNVLLIFNSQKRYKSAGNTEKEHKDYYDEIPVDETEIQKFVRTKLNPFIENPYFIGIFIIVFVALSLTNSYFAFPLYNESPEDLKEILVAFENNPEITQLLGTHPHADGVITYQRVSQGKYLISFEVAGNDGELNEKGKCSILMKYKRVFTWHQVLGCHFALGGKHFFYEPVTATMSKIDPLNMNDIMRARSVFDSK